ncbi:MAG: hypothetical protein U9Q21_02610 [Candidatus Auribacterota bacterium]|nr:hypothetical protein [Candidatus Auribacterota bacterium]
MASTDARFRPLKKVAFRVKFPILDNTGALVSGATGLDSEISKDDAAFADCSNEATEIGSTGMYYLDLTDTEMNADSVIIIVKTTTTDAKTTPIVLYTRPGIQDGEVFIQNGVAASSVGTYDKPFKKVSDIVTALGADGLGHIAHIVKDPITDTDNPTINFILNGRNVHWTASPVGNYIVKLDGQGGIKDMFLENLASGGDDICVQIAVINNSESGVRLEKTILRTNNPANKEAIGLDGDVYNSIFNELFIMGKIGNTNDIACLFGLCQFEDVHISDGFTDYDVRFAKCHLKNVYIGSALSIAASSDNTNFENLVVEGNLTIPATAHGMLFNRLTVYGNITIANGAEGAMDGVYCTGTITNSAPTTFDIRESPEGSELNAAFLKLPSQYIMGSNVQSSKDDEIDAIKAKTDNLPADPATVTNQTAIDGKVDIVDTVVDAIKAKTDNLPADPASDTNVDANETKIDAVKVDTAAIKAKTDTLAFTGGNVHSHLKAQDDLGLGTTAKADVNAEVDQSLLDYDSGSGVAKESSVNSIQNNTRFVAGLPQYMLIPAAGNNVYKLIAYFYDNSGNPEDPDSNEIALHVETAAGADKSGLLYDDYGAATPATASTTFTGYKKLIRDGVGRFHTYLKIASSESQNQFVYDFALKEATVELHYTRSNLITTEQPGTSTLSDSAANKDIIAEAMKERDVSGTIAVSGSVEKDIMDNIDSNETKIDTVDTVVDAIKAKTDNLPADPASDTNVDANEAKIDAVKVDTAAIKAKTDNLPASPANETTAAAIKAKTDNLPADPATVTNQTSIESKLDTVDAVADVINAKTDNLPADPAATSDISALNDITVAEIFNAAAASYTTEGSIGWVLMLIFTGAVTKWKIYNDANDNDKLKVDLYDYAGAKKKTINVLNPTGQQITEGLHADSMAERSGV